MKLKRKTVVLLMALWTAWIAPALELGSPFTDGAVLQRDRRVPVWGRAEPGDRVTVRFAGQAKTAVADAKGRWRADLDAMPASKTGRHLSVSSDREKASRTVSDVLVGEVWFCSGQSNCGVPMAGESPHYRERYGAMRAQITDRPLVRLAYWGRHSMALEPLERTENPVRWFPLTPRNVTARDPWATTAIACSFALELYAALDVPVGVMQHFWGGVGIDSWIPREGYAKHPELAYERDLKRYSQRDYRPELFEREHFKWGCQQQPSVLWNAFVDPIAPYAIRGLLWHQGCNNCGKDEAPRYARKLHALYDGWSEKFQNPNLRLYYAQLADYHDPLQVPLRLQQARFEKEQTNASMVVTCDVGVDRDIHAPDKGIVGTRLALKALKRDYGFDIEDSSPEVASWTVETNTVRLTFAHAKSIYFYNGDWSLRNLFELKDGQGLWHPATIVNYRPESAAQRAKGRLADGRLVGAGLVLSAAGVAHPKGVRHLFKPPYRSNFFNEVNLPLGPFVFEENPSPRLPEIPVRPLLPGCHGDPSVCRVGDTYYMITTSFAWWPGQPVYKSRDFRRWELVGHVAASESWKRYLLAQNDSYGLWAATIRHYDGLFYVVGTRRAADGRDRFETYLTAAKDPAGPWSEPRLIAGAGGIDPDLFRDRDGAFYLILNGWYPADKKARRHAITIAGFDLETCALKERPRILSTGLTTKSRSAEGGHLYRFDDRDFGSKYLLTLAEGGTGDKHATVALWSTRDIYGPYVAQTNNPVITRRETPRAPLTGTGHSDLVTTPDGGYHAVFLGTRRYPAPYDGNTILGRECYGCRATVANDELVYDQAHLIAGEIVEPKGYNYLVPMEGVRVRRLTEPTFDEELETPAFDGHDRGLILYRTERCYVLLVRHRDRLEVTRSAWDGKKTVASVPCPPQEKVRLRMSVDYANISLSAAVGAAAWTPVGKPVSHEPFRYGWEGTGVGTYVSK